MLQFNTNRLFTVTSIPVEADQSIEAVILLNDQYFVKFRFCKVIADAKEQLVRIIFPDGAEAHASPHDTPEYHQHALQKTGTDDVYLYCFQHDVFHIIHGEMKGKPSVVLWALAHGESTETAECEQEEREVQELQWALQMGR